MNRAPAIQGQLIRTWGILVGLTALSTALHFSAMNAQIIGAAVLLAAWIKARLILLDYLELRGVAGWAAGILFVLAVFVTLLMVLLVVA